MAAGVLALVDAVAPVRINHHAELFVGFDQRVDQPLRALVVDVVIAAAVNQQQVALKLSGIRDRRTSLVAERVLLRQAHIALLVDGVVQPEVGHGRHCHPGSIDFRMLEHQVQGGGAAAAPAPDRHAGRIDVRPAADDLACCRGLILRGDDTDFVVNRFAPLAAAGRRCAAIVDAGDEIPLLRQKLMPEHAAAAPAIEHGLAGRLAVNIKEQRVFLRRIEIRRFHHPAVQDQPVADIDAEELRLNPERLDFPPQLGIVGQHANTGVPRQFDHRFDRRRGKSRVGVNGPLRVWRNLVAVRARLVCRGEPLRRSGAVELRPVEVTLGRVVG